MVKNSLWYPSGTMVPLGYRYKLTHWSTLRPLHMAPPIFLKRTHSQYTRYSGSTINNVGNSLTLLGFDYDIDPHKGIYNVGDDDAKWIHKPKELQRIQLDTDRAHRQLQTIIQQHFAIQQAAVIVGNNNKLKQVVNFNKKTEIVCTHCQAVVCPTCRAPLSKRTDRTFGYRPCRKASCKKRS